MAAWSVWEKIKYREKEELGDGSVKIAVDLSEYINLPGQYAVKVTPDPQKKIELLKAEIYYEGQPGLDEYVTISGDEVRINRTAMVTDESSSVLYLTIKGSDVSDATFEFRPALIY